MMRAIWNGKILAQTPRTRLLEGNHHFPPESLSRELLTTSRTKSLCPCKGPANYHTITTDRDVNPDAAWHYPHPSPLARQIKNHAAFRNGITVEGTREAKPEKQKGRG